MARKKNTFPIKGEIRLESTKLGSDLRSINKKFRGAFAPVRKLRNQIADIGTGAGLGELSRGIGRVASKAAHLGGLLTVAGIGLAAGGAAAFRSFTKAGDNIAKTSTRLGIGVEALQEYRFAAERSGIRAETFDMAMQRMGRRTAEAARGMGEARGALNFLGVATRDAEGRVRSIDSLLPELADKLSQVESASERNALAMKLFDSEGVALVQMLAEGSAGLADLRKEARRLGLVLTTEQVAATAKFEDAWTGVKGSLTGVRNTIGAELLPEILNLAKGVTEGIVKSGPAIKAWAANFGEALPGQLEAAGAGATKLWAGISAGAGVASSFVSSMGGIKGALLSLGIVGAGVGVFAIASTGPLGLAIAGFTALAVAIQQALAWMDRYDARTGHRRATPGEVMAPNFGQPSAFAPSPTTSYPASGVGPPFRQSPGPLRDALNPTFESGPPFRRPLELRTISIEEQNELRAQRARRNRAQVGERPIDAAPPRGKIEIQFKNAPAGTEVRVIEAENIDLDVGSQESGF